MSAPCVDVSGDFRAGDLWGELWISLSSLLRSYTAVHGLHRNLEATVTLDEDRIVVRRGDKQLELERSGCEVRWNREDGNSGLLQLTETGRLRGTGPNRQGEEEMDMAAEAWAREIMQ